MEKLYRLDIKAIIKYTAGERWAFYAILLYLIFEYMRPQTMYPALDIIPWGKTIIAVAILASIYESSFLKNTHTCNKLLFIFTCIVLASSLSAYSPGAAFMNIGNFFILITVYILITSIVNTEKRYFVFTLVFVLLTLKLAQAVSLKWVFRGFSYDRYGAAVGSGWLENSGELAIQICIVFGLLTSVSLALRGHLSKIKWSFVVFCIALLGLAVIACGSRGGFMALAGVLLFMWLGASKKFVGILLLLVCAITFISLLPERDFERTFKLEGELDKTAQTRLERWRIGWVLTTENPVLGVGFANWPAVVGDRFGTHIGAVHNIYLECSSELGLTGLLIFGTLVISCYRTNNRTAAIGKNIDNSYITMMARGQNYALIAYLIAGTFVTVFYYPYFWINLGMTVALNNIAVNSIGDPVDESA